MNVSQVSEQKLLSQVLGRETSFFTQDIRNNRERLMEKIRGRRILMIGAAGSIGAAVAQALVDYSPLELHLVDINENNLVELVRDLRSSRRDAGSIRTFSIALGSPEFFAFLSSEGPYDDILNFAALKHVRAERDPYSLMRMLLTNTVYPFDLLEFLRESRKPPQRFFSVSSDKAVRPVSLMGATKLLMEQIMWRFSDQIDASSARFANVAFSDGSLLDGFLRRLQKRQPLSGPSDIRRFFISREEAAQLCLMACFLGGNREIYIPKMDPGKDQKLFSNIAVSVLEAYGYEPLFCSTEEEARQLLKTGEAGQKQWPCFFSPSDTTGEKPCEEFFSTEEIPDMDRYESLGVLTAPAPGTSGQNRLEDFRKVIKETLSRKSWTKSDLSAAVEEALMEYRHCEVHRHLDDKM